ncbi:hypothetical protein BVRB_2g036330 [Beta vulgaris subsp. vulgaris]|nr:hypothetical protein BVRB_2g036330 [Beta vulgaris subsp. vulgaris]
MKKKGRYADEAERLVCQRSRIVGWQSGENDEEMKREMRGWEREGNDV